MLEEKDFFGKWSDVIKRMKFTEREPFWQKAIVHMIKEGDLEPTMMLSLPFGIMEGIIFAKGIKGEECSIWGLLTDLTNWINDGQTNEESSQSVSKNIANYLSLYFFDGADTMLAYLMASQYALFWNGERWGIPEST